MVLLRFLMRVLGLVSASILARILVPEDFGLVGISLSLIASLEAFTTFGTNLAIIRERAAARDLYDTAWTIELARGVLIATLLAILARPAADFFGDPRIGPVIFAIAVGALIQAGENIGIVDFMKGLRFDQEFRLFLSTKVIAFVVTIGAAILLRNHWALVLGYLAHRSGRTALSYAMHPYRPRLSLRAWREIFSFSSWVWIFSLIGFANSQGQTLIAGRLLDTRQLGFFRVGTEIGALPATEIQVPVLRVLFPGLSRIGDEPKRFAQLFADAFRTILLIQAALSVGLALVAEPFVRVVYGEAWIGMAPLVAFVAVATFFQIPVYIAEPALIAAGNLKLFSAIVFASTAIRLPLLTLGLHFWGLAGAGWALVAASVFEAALTIMLATRALGLTLADLARGSWRCGLAAAAMAAAVSEVAAAWPRPGSLPGHAAMLVALVLVGGAAFVACQVTLWLAAGKPDGAEAHLSRFLGERFAMVKFRPSSHSDSKPFTVRSRRRPQKSGAD